MVKQLSMNSIALVILQQNRTITTFQIHCVVNKCTGVCPKLTVKYLDDNIVI